MKWWLKKDTQKLASEFGRISGKELAEHLGIAVTYAPLGESIYGYNSINHRIQIITINEAISTYAQDATIFHETGHVRHHKKINTQFFDVNGVDLMTNGYEVEANEFMLAMLENEYNFRKDADKLEVLDMFSLPHSLQFLME